MVRMSKAKQDKLESIMHLVEQLGIDRVLGRLRQTKMMSKDVLDDMKEWETDYEKRVALLGFLVSPEGKRAFGALYELSKVHEEQLKLQEEQEKLRQEQLAQQPNADLRKFGGRGKGHHGAAVNANMKLKLRQQLAKRRDPVPAAGQKQGQGDQAMGPPQPQTQQIPIPPPNTSKSGKRSPGGVVTKKGVNKEADESKATASGEVESQAKSDDASTTNDKSAKDVKSSSPTVGAPRSRGNSETAPIPNKASGMENGLDLSLTGSAVSAPIPSPIISKPGTTRTRTSSVGSMSPGPLQAKSLEDFSHARARETSSAETEAPTDGQWGRSDSVEVEGSEEDGGHSMIIEEDRPPPDGENPEDNKDENEATEGTSKKVRISNTVKVVEARDTAPNSPSTTTSTPVVRRRKLCDVHQKLLSGETSVDKLTMDQIREIVAEWQIMKKEQGNDGDYLIKEMQHAKDDLKRMTEEKDRIRKEKDRYVFKEFELQQKLQDLSQKHKSLREDHESLKQGNYQIQQNTKKNNKIHQEMRKKIAKLESKIKSMDKVTVRKGTQTTEVFDKDVHEALRVAEESLQVVQSELKDALAKSKNAQQEAEDLKKQLNAKGREINKRERKSKKDEETIRLVTRERDSMETKLRKVTEQLEYYKGMLEIRTKGGKRQVPEKKEVRVQRCSSGRHVVLKTHVAGRDEDCKSQAKQDPEESRNGATRNGRNSLTNGNASTRQSRPVASKAPSQQTATKPTSDSTAQNKSAPKLTNGSSASSSNSAKVSSGTTASKPSANNENKTSQSRNTAQTSNPAQNKNASQPIKPAQSRNTTQNSNEHSDGNKQAQAKHPGSESPSVASKERHVSFSPGSFNSPKQPVGSTSPNPGQRQQHSHDEKPARPKAATVRPANNQPPPQRK